MSQRYHFIAIGGAVMHQLAIYLHQQGNIVTGSDDVIFDPAKSNLEQNGLLPKRIGWDKNHINDTLDGVILGMHAKKDNPELLKALQLKIPIYSFPEFIFQHSKNKKRVVIGGSHGKTSITSMIMHILNTSNIAFDYLVGSSIKGFETMVKISDAPVIILEGDEYLSSPLDSRSKFLHYQPHVAVLSGIAWDHINVFPTFEEYLETFRKFIASVSDKLIYYKNDKYLQEITKDAKCSLQPYEAFDVDYNDYGTTLTYKNKSYVFQIFGEHNMENMKAAVLVAKELGIAIEDSLSILQSFEGAAKRLEPFYQNKEDEIAVYRDFAHAPSKLKASLNALRAKYTNQKIIAMFELHTYSSLQDDFLPHYRDALSSGDEKVLFIDKDALKIKNRPDIENDKLLKAFNDNSIAIIREKETLVRYLEKRLNKNTVYAFMSSGNFNGLNIKEWIDTNIVKK